MESKKQRYGFVDALKCIAILLVLNSHFDSLYPIPALGTGGSLGNGLFFAVSGFCLWPVSGSFAVWMWKRVKRLYVPTLLMTFLVLLTTSRGLLKLSNAFFIFIWPTMFWFIGGITFFYILYYILRDIKSKKQFVALFSVLAVMYIIGYLVLDTSVWTVDSTWVIEDGLDNFWVGSFKLIYNFAMMMMGKYVRLYITNSQCPSAKMAIFGAGGGILSLYLVKYLMSRFPPLMHLQFLNHVSVICFVLSMLLLGLQLERQGWFSREDTLTHIIRKFSSVSLEAYLVQGMMIGIASNLPFPVNIVLAVVLTMICAIVLHKVILQINKLLKMLEFKRAKGA